jgi:hypothetical protein
MPRSKCPYCGKDVCDEDFKDALSVAENEISGLCQACQDEIFEGTEKNHTQTLYNQIMQG